VREIVIVIADLYLPPGTSDSAAEVAAAFARVPGLQAVGRFGTRAPLPQGWRAWLARWAGHGELADIAPAEIAAAVLDGAQRPQAQPGTRWIATPLELRASHLRVHLEHRGLLSLAAEEQQLLAVEFAGTFGGAGSSLAPLPSGDFLLSTPGLAAHPATEPARSAGGDVAAALPRGAAAGPLRRLVAEIEMWLHALALNELRTQRGEPPVTALWPWGAGDRRQGGRQPPAARAAGSLPLAFGRDAWLAGLWHLQGGSSRPLPQRLEPVLAAGTDRAVVVAEVGRELQCSHPDTVAEAVARLDERLVLPAWRALTRGELAQLTVIVGDARVQSRRTSRLRLWRRPRAGLRSFA
jgi:hypothetical protein